MAARAAGGSVGGVGTTGAGGWVGVPAASDPSITVSSKSLLPLLTMVDSDRLLFPPPKFSLGAA